MTEKKVELPEIPFESPDEWENWLAQNHDNSRGIWMKFYKKDSGVKTIVYSEALDTALCYGWIDSQLKGGDHLYYLQKFTPRRPSGPWSARNVGHVERLTAEGRMKPAGLKQVEAARADGRWGKAYDPPGNMVIPEDFLCELRKNMEAYTFFETLNKTNRYAIGWRLQTARKEETRARRMKQILEMLAKKEKFH